MFKISKLFILLSSFFILNACAAAWFAAGGVATLGGYKYMEGHVAVEYPLAYDEAWDATNKALENLKISISSSMSEGNNGKIEALQKDGIKIVATLEDNGRGITTISIRVGTLGNKSEAEKIHNEIVSVAGI